MNQMFIKKRSLDYFETIYEESESNMKVMALAMHPYLSGSPHRIKYVRQTFEEILSKPGVIAWDGIKILDWFKKVVQKPATL